MYPKFGHPVQSPDTLSKVRTVKLNSIFYTEKIIFIKLEWRFEIVLARHVTIQGIPNRVLFDKLSSY